MFSKNTQIEPVSEFDPHSLQRPPHSHSFQPARKIWEREVGIYACFAIFFYSVDTTVLALPGLLQQDDVVDTKSHPLA